MQRKAWARDIYRIARTYAGTWLKEGELGVIDWRDWCERCRKRVWERNIHRIARALCFGYGPKAVKDCPGELVPGYAKAVTKRRMGVS